MMLATEPDSTISRRHYSRWRVKHQRSQLAQFTLNNSIGQLMDLSLNGFRARLTQPLSTAEADKLLLILHQAPQPRKVIAVKATPVWMSADQTAKRWTAGFHIIDHKADMAMSILQHLKTHKADYTVESADAKAPALPQKTTATASPLPQHPLNVILFGFSASERRLLNNIITLSALWRSKSKHPEPLRYVLHPKDAETAADLALVDADDPQAVDACTGYLMQQPQVPVIKVTDKHHADSNYEYIDRRLAPEQTLMTLDCAYRNSMAARNAKK